VVVVVGAGDVVVVVGAALVVVAVVVVGEVVVVEGRRLERVRVGTGSSPGSSNTSTTGLSSGCGADSISLANTKAVTRPVVDPASAAIVIASGAGSGETPGRRSPSPVENTAKPPNVKRMMSVASPRGPAAHFSCRNTPPSFVPRTQHPRRPTRLTARQVHPKREPGKQWQKSGPVDRVAERAHHISVVTEPDNMVHEEQRKEAP